MVSDFRLGGRSVDGLGQLVGLSQALRQGNAADRAVLLIAGPSAAGNKTADDTLDREHVKLPAHHTVPVELRRLEELRHIPCIR